MAAIDAVPWAAIWLGDFDLVRWKVQVLCRDFAVKKPKQGNKLPVSEASLALLPDGVGPTHSGRTGRFAVEFLEPQVAVAAGQALVLHEGDRVIGGGWIDRAG